MSIVTHEGLTYQLLYAGQTATHDDAGVREYVSVYTVHVDDPTDGPASILANWGGPDFNDTYEHGTDFDRQARLISLVPERVDGTRLLWKVTAQWRWEFLDPQGKGQQKPQLGLNDKNEPTEDPLDFQDEVEVSYSLMAAPVELAVKYLSGFTGLAGQRWQPGKRDVPVVNSAFVTLDPPIERDEPRQIIRVTKNLVNFPVADWALVNHINRGPWRFNKVGFNELYQNHMAKLQNVQGVYTRQNAVNFWKTTYEVHINFERWSTDPPNGKGTKGWDVEILDRGLEARWEEGYPDGKGGVIQRADVKTGGPATRRLVDANGVTLATPIPFNGDGQPLGTRPGKPPGGGANWQTTLPIGALQKVYLRYQIYRDTILPQL